MRRKGELRLIEKAIRDGWQTSAQEVKRAMQLVDEVLADPKANRRELEACRRIKAMTKPNISSVCLVDPNRSGSSSSALPRH